MSSDEELPSLLDCQYHFQSKNEQSIEDLYNNNCRLSQQLVLEKVVKQDVDADEVNEIATELGNASIEADVEGKQHPPTDFFIKPAHPQYFLLNDVTLLKCGYESITELSTLEQFLLTLESDDIHELISHTRVCGEIQNVNPFVHYILKTMSLHSNWILVAASKTLLHCLVTKSRMEDIKFSSGDIFQLLFNCSVDVTNSVIFKILPHGSIAPNSCIAEEPIPKHWLPNLKAVLSCLSELLKGCTIVEEDLCNIIVYFLIMSTEAGSFLYSELQKCLVISLSRFSPDSWPIYRSNIANTLATLSADIPVNKRWFYIYTMVKLIPIFSSSNGVELRKYISVLALLNLTDDDTLNHSLEYSEELFSLSKLMIILSSFYVIEEYLLHVAIQFLDILVNHLKFTPEEYYKVCKLLKMAETSIEKKFGVSSNLSHLVMIYTRINLNLPKKISIKRNLVAQPGRHDDYLGENDDYPSENDDYPSENDDYPSENDDQMLEDDHVLEDSHMLEDNHILEDNHMLEDNYMLEDDHMLEKQDTLNENCNTLQDRTEQRKIELQASIQLQQFLASVQDDENWALGLCSTLNKEEEVRDEASAQLLKSELEQMENEIEAREGTFSAIVNASKEMIEGGSNARNETQERLNQLLAVRRDLHAAWQKKNVYLDQLCDLQCFLRNAILLDTISSDQETYLSSFELGNTVEEVDVQIKVHEAFDKLLATQNEKLIALQDHGANLLQQNHFDCETIRKRVLEITNRRSKVRDLSNLRKQNLANFLHAQFKKDATEAEALLEDKKMMFEALKDMSEMVILEDKTRKLQKLEAFQAELDVNEIQILDVRQKGELLLSKNHIDSIEIRQQLKRLLKEWRDLTTLSAYFRVCLVHTEDLMEFNNQSKKIEALIGDMEMIVQASDTGKDFEHCQALQKKLNDMNSEMQVGEVNINTMDSLVSKIILEGRPYTQFVQQKQEELNTKLNALQGAISLYCQKLTHASEVHAFDKDLDDTNNRINKKILVLSVEEETKDMESVESCQMKLQTTEKNMTVIKTKLKEQHEAWKIVQKDLEVSQQTGTKLSEVQKNWRKLTNLWLSRKQSLSSAHALYKFLSEVKELESWVNDITTRITSDEEQKVEMNISQEATENLKEFDHHHSEQKISSKEIIETKLQSLEEKHSSKAIIETKLQQLEVNFLCMEPCVSDINTQHLTSEKLGTNDAQLQSMIHLHQERKIEINGRQEAIKSLKELGHRLLQQEHSSKEIIATKLQHLEELLKNLTQVLEERRQVVIQTRHLQIFQEMTEDVESWLSNDEALLSNEDLGDSLSSVDVLIKKQDDFEKTTSDQSNKMKEFEDLATALITAKHYDSQAVQNKCQAVRTRRDKLNESALIRRKKLQESKEFQKYLSHNNEVVNWIKEKLQVALDESYRDPTNLRSKIEEQAAFEAQVHFNKTRVEALMTDGKKLIDSSHFASVDIQNLLQELEVQWKQLLDQSALKKEHLQAAYEAVHFNCKVKELHKWMDEIEVHLLSEDHSKDLISVMIPLKKHQLLETDFRKHAENIEQIKNINASFQKDNHFLKEDTEEKSVATVTRYQLLQDCVRIQKQKLEGSLLIRQFNKDVDNELSWICAKNCLAASIDLGNNLETVQNLQKKHQDLEADIHTHEPLIATVVSRGKEMIKIGHYASSNVETKLEQLQTALQTLKKILSTRTLRLSDAVKSQTFYSEATKAECWIRERKHLLSLDLGKDEDSVQSLIKELDEVEQAIQSFDSNIKELAKLSQDLIKKGHFDSKNIQKMRRKVEAHYSKLKQLAKDRGCRLQESKIFFNFVKDANEVATWVLDKMNIANSKDYGKDIKDIEVLEEEIHAREPLIATTVSKGEEMIKIGHYASSNVEAKLKRLQTALQTLKAFLSARKLRLMDAVKSETFYSEATKSECWIRERKPTLISLDLGKDEDSVQSLIKELDEVEQAIQSFNSNILELAKLSHALIEKGHFDSENIQKKQREVEANYTELKHLAKDRGCRLQESKKFFNFIKDVNEVAKWVLDKMNFASSEDYGKDIKDFEVLEEEIHAREPLIATTVSKGEEMIKIGHYASSTVEAKLKRLQTALQKVKAFLSARKLRLVDAVKSETFYSEATKAECWIRERKPLLISLDLGKDEDSVQSLIKELDEIEQAIQSFNSNILELAKLSQALIEKGHFDSENIQKKQREVEANYAELEHLVKERGCRLQESKKFYSFIRDADEVAAWIQDKMVIASSKDYGKEAKHIEILIQKFEGFLSSIHSNDDRVANLENAAATLLKENHPESQKIIAKSKEISHMWEELKECAQSRQEALAGVRKVHTLSSKADLKTVKALDRQYDSFEVKCAPKSERVVQQSPIPTVTFHENINECNNPVYSTGICSNIPFFENEVAAEVELSNPSPSLIDNFQESNTSSMPDIILSHNTPETLSTPTTPKRQPDSSEPELDPTPEKRFKTTESGHTKLTSHASVRTKHNADMTTKMNLIESVIVPPTKKSMISKYQKNFTTISKSIKSNRSKVVTNRITQHQSTYLSNPSCSKREIPVVEIDDSDDDCRIVGVKGKPETETICLD